MIGVLLLSLLTAFSGAIVPGSLFALTVNQALLVGWMAGVWLMVGHSLAELALIIALRFGLGGFLQRPRVTRAIGMVGGIVLLYFAWSMIALALGGTFGVSDGHGAMSIGMLILQGALMSLLNPYWGLWWATVGIGLIATQTQRHGPRAWPVFYLGHITADFIWYVAIAILVALGGSRLNEHLHRGLILVCGILIAIFGVLFLVRPVQQMLRDRPLSPAKGAEHPVEM